MACQNCGSLLIGEQHVKKSGKVYRYYRCNQKTCRIYLRADEIEALVLDDLRTLLLSTDVTPSASAICRTEQNETAQPRELSPMIDDDANPKEVLDRLNAAFSTIDTVEQYTVLKMFVKRVEIGPEELRIMLTERMARSTVRRVELENDTNKT